MSNESVINMKTMKMSKLKKAMEIKLTPQRYEHTLGVAYTAAALAMRYDVSMEAAQIAGLLHDCAKCISDEEKLFLCEKYQIDVTNIEHRNPYLLHAKVGTFLAEHDYGVEDYDILNAIRYHTTGRPNMSPLEKIIFVSDYIEPSRNHASNLTKIRKLSFINLDHALIQILTDTISYLKSNGNQEIDSLTEDTYRFYVNLQ